MYLTLTLGETPEQNYLPLSAAGSNKDSTIYTEREMLFPLPFTCVHTKVVHPLSPILLPVLSVS